MDTSAVEITVFFKDPFWVGVFERECKGKLEVAKVVFGAEPKDYEVYDYFLTNWDKLRFSPPVAERSQTNKKMNPKRMQREIHSQLTQMGIGTKAQQAIKLMQEQNKLERKSENRQKAEEGKEKKFVLHQIKRKEKHRGR
nr:YjdF family protein [uncultured Caproiciproducens sp.]